MRRAHTATQSSTQIPNGPLTSMDEELVVEQGCASLDFIQVESTQKRIGCGLTCGITLGCVVEGRVKQEVYSEFCILMS